MASSRFARCNCFECPFRPARPAQSPDALFSPQVSLSHPASWTSTWCSWAHPSFRRSGTFATRRTAPSRLARSTSSTSRTCPPSPPQCAPPYHQQSCACDTLRAEPVGEHALKSARAGLKRPGLTAPPLALMCWRTRCCLDLGVLTRSCCTCIDHT